MININRKYGCSHTLRYDLFMNVNQYTFDIIILNIFDMKNV